jgi:hypothetical protein
VTARQPFGRITIANSDAAAYAYTDAAIDQGYRAVQELCTAWGQRRQPTRTGMASFWSPDSS